MTTTSKNHFGFPDVVTTLLAAIYAECDRSTITRAAKGGMLQIAGRRGKKLLFRLDDVRAFKLGLAAETSATAGVTSAVARTNKPMTIRAARSSRSSSTVQESIARVRAAAAGGAR